MLYKWEVKKALSDDLRERMGSKLPWGDPPGPDWKETELPVKKEQSGEEKIE